MKCIEKKIYIYVPICLISLVYIWRTLYKTRNATKNTSIIIAVWYSLQFHEILLRLPHENPDTNTNYTWIKHNPVNPQAWTFQTTWKCGSTFIVNSLSKSPITCRNELYLTSNWIQQQHLFHALICNFTRFSSHFVMISLITSTETISFTPKRYSRTTKAK